MLHLFRGNRTYFLLAQIATLHHVQRKLFISLTVVPHAHCLPHLHAWIIYEHFKDRPQVSRFFSYEFFKMHTFQDWPLNRLDAIVYYRKCRHCRSSTGRRRCRFSACSTKSTASSTRSDAPCSTTLKQNFHSGRKISPISGLLLATSFSDYSPVWVKNAC